MYRKNVLENNKNYLSEICNDNLKYIFTLHCKLKDTSFRVLSNGLENVFKINKKMQTYWKFYQLYVLPFHCKSKGTFSTSSIK